MLPNLTLIDQQMLIDTGVDVLKHSDFQDILMGENILEAAKHQQQSMIREAAEIQAKEKEEGYKQGLKQAKKEYAEKLVEFELRKSSNLQNLEQKFIRLITTTLRSIVGNIPLDDLTVSRTKLAMERFKSEEAIVLSICEQDVDVVTAQLAAWRNSDPDLVIEQRVSSSILPGDCRIETSVSVLDLTLHDQFEMIEKTLKNTVSLHEDNH